MKRVKGSRWKWLLCTAVFSVLAAAARLWQMSTAFEGDLYLAIPRAPASMLLCCVLVIGAAALLLLAVRQRICIPPEAGKQGRRWDTMLRSENMVYPLIMVAAGFFMLVSVPVMFSQGLASASGRQNRILAIAMSVLALLGFFGLLLAARDAYRPGRRGKGGFSLMMPALAGCIWLMESYRTHASDPVMWDYVPLLLAVVSGMLFYIDCAGMAWVVARPRRTLWLAGVTVMLSAVALVKNGGLGDILLLTSQLLAALATLWLMPENLECPPERGGREREQPQPRQEIQEETTNE